MKGIKFVGSSLDDLKNFTPAARRVAGDELRRVQRGLEPSDWKPMPVVGPGACEIRIRLEGAWRVIYVAKWESAVYVLHAFRKKERKTALRDISIAQRRYGALKKLS